MASSIRDIDMGLLCARLQLLHQLSIVKEKKEKETVMQTVKTNASLVPRGMKKPEHLKGLHLYTRKSDDPNVTWFIRTGKSKDSPKYAYRWIDSTTVRCIGGDTMDKLIDYHRDPVNLVFLRDHLKMDTLLVDNYVFVLEEDLGNVEVTEYKRTPLEVPESRWPKSQKLTDMSPGNIMDNQIKSPVDDVTETPTVNPEKLEEHIETFFKVTIRLFNLMEPTVKQEKVSQPYTEKHNPVHPTLGAVPLMGEDLKPWTSSKNGPVTPTLKSNIIYAESPMLSRMLEELSWYPDYEYALLNRGACVSQDRDGNYRVKMVLHVRDGGEEIGVIKFNHRRNTPPFYFL